MAKTLLYAFVNLSYIAYLLLVQPWPALGKAMGPAFFKYNGQDVHFFPWKRTVAPPLHQIMCGVGGIIYVKNVHISLNYSKLYISMFPFNCCNSNFRYEKTSKLLPCCFMTFVVSNRG